MYETKLEIPVYFHLSRVIIHFTQPKAQKVGLQGIYTDRTGMLLTTLHR